MIEQRALSLAEVRRFGAAGVLFAIVDATDAPAVPGKMEEFGGVSLFAGTPLEEHVSVAPYLVRVNDPVLAWLWTTMWQEPWGVFVAAQADPEALAAHLRQLLYVAAPTGERWYFRYYDPRVLGKFLGTCFDWELGKLYGPARAFGVSAGEQVTLLAPAARREGATEGPLQIRPEQLAALGG